MILVIGSTGTVGREVVRQLAEQGQPVRAFVHHPEKAAKWRRLPVEIAVGDLEDPATVVPACQGIHKVFLVTPSHPRQVRWERNAVEAALQHGIEQVVKISTLGADPGAPLLMAQWHGESEEFIKNSGTPYTFLRCHNFMQNTLDYAPSIAAEGIIRAPLGAAKLAMVDARDAAEVAVKILTENQSANRIYRLTGPEAITYREVAEILTEVSGKPVRYNNISFAEAERMMLKAGMPRWYTEDLIKLYRRFREGKGARVWSDLPELSGRRARTFREFAEDYQGVFKGFITLDR